MKKFVFLMIIALAVAAANAQLSATQVLPEQYEHGAPFTATITILPTDSENFDVSLLLPVTWEITEWQVNGNSSEANFEKTTISYKGKVNEIFHWLFNGPSSEEIVITYTAMPLTGGEQKITLMWFYPEGFGSKEDDIFVSGEPAAVCGDGICQSAYGESLFTCPVDCAFRFRENIAVWLSILIFAMVIMFLGMFYKIHRIYKRKKTESEIPMAMPIVGTIREPQVFKKMAESSKPVKPGKKAKKKKTPKKKPVKKKISGVKKVKSKVVRKMEKKKKTPKKKAPKKKAVKRKPAKHTEFYSDTMKKLAKIRKSLK